MEIYLICDYDNKIVEATCDGLKASQMVDELNEYREDFPYYYLSIELHDIPQPAVQADADTRQFCST
jgi:hypothetical protein